MIKICDHIMGGGKSTACINYMNEHPEKKYIYITPYVDEATRIAKACPKLRFLEPSRKKKETGFSKSKDTAAMIANGRNIASTHQCFLYYTHDMLEQIRDGEYTLMIDENVNVLEESKDISLGDIELLMRGGHITKDNGCYRLTDMKYTGRSLRQPIRLLQSRDLIEESCIGKSLFFWTLPEDLLTAFKDVIVMTYLFDGTDMYYYFNMRGLEYEKIGVRFDETGYHFCEGPSVITDSMRELKNKIHICDKKSANAIGEEWNALSMNWLSKSIDDENIVRLRMNLSNWFNNDHRNIPAKKRLWATIDDSHGKLRSAGVWNNNLPFNYRATNNYADRIILAYPVNVFVNVGKKNYFNRNGLEFHEDQYALSMMIQWIWRSAIRNGEDIWIYIPSRRMRELLQGWLDSLANQQNNGIPTNTETLCA